MVDNRIYRNPGGKLQAPAHHVKVARNRLPMGWQGMEPGDRLACQFVVAAVPFHANGSGNPLLPLLQWWIRSPE